MPAVTLLCTLLLASCSRPTSTALQDTGRQRFNRLYLESVNCRLRGDYAAQHELLNEALRICPDAPEALYDLGLLKLQHKYSEEDLSEGERLLKKAISIMPHDEQFRTTLMGEYLMNLNEPEKALEQCRALIAIKEKPTLLYMEAMLCLDLGLHEEGIKALERYETLEGTDINTTKTKCQMILETGDTLLAYERFEEFCQTEPDNLEWRVAKGIFYHDNGHFANARKEWLDVLAKDEINVSAQNALLLHYAQLQEDSLFCDLLEKFMANPIASTPNKYKIMVKVLLPSEKYRNDSTFVCHLFDSALALPQDDASLSLAHIEYLVYRKSTGPHFISSLENHLQLDPGNKSVRFELVKHYSLNHPSSPESFDLCLEGTVLNPEEPLFYYFGFRHLLLNGRDNEAPSFLEKSWKKISDKDNPEVVSEIYSYLGDYRYEEGKIEDAFEAYEEALRIDSDNMLCLNNYAYFLSLEGRDLEHAESMSRQTIEAEPENPTYLDTYAWILYLLKRYDEAATFIDKTLEYAEETADNATLYDHAGDIHFKCGNAQKAVTLWKKAQALTNDETLFNKLKQKIRKKSL